MARLPLPEDYILATLKYTEERLNSLPGYRMANRGGILKVVSNYPRHEYRLDKPTGRSLLPIVNEREHLLKVRRELLLLWKKLYSGSIDTRGITLNDVSRIMGDDLWYELKADSNSYKKTDDLFHNGIRLRSRGEMLVNEVLDRLGLEYIYEPEIVIDGRSYSPDFVVHIPTFGCCFIIEYLGCMDDHTYVEKNKNKISSYLHAGIFPGRDLILLCANANSAPTFDMIYNSIVSLLADLCSIYVKKPASNAACHSRHVIGL